MEFQSGSPSIYYRISNVVHWGCVDILWNSPLLNIDWLFEFSDFSVEEMTSVFTTLVMDMMFRYIPNKMINPTWTELSANLKDWGAKMLPPPNLAISSQMTMKLGRDILWIKILTN